MGHPAATRSHVCSEHLAVCGFQGISGARWWILGENRKTLLPLWHFLGRLAATSLQTLAPQLKLASSSAPLPSPYPDPPSVLTPVCSLQ